jgi:uncharacterized membrane protein YraQ (UPF0718 family)
MKRDDSIKIAGISGYLLFLIASLAFGFNPGKEIGRNFVSFSIDMLKLLPCAFILIGLFEVWVKRETVERHFGEESGIRGYIWALPLYGKGAKLSIILTYIGASGICRVPMAIFETSFMGIKFTIIRLMVSIPLVILTSIALGDYLTKRNYKTREGK